MSGEANPGALTIRSVEIRGVRVPLTFALGTSAAVVPAVPMLLIDLQTEEGVVGRTYAFCYTASGATAVAGHIEEVVAGMRGQTVTPVGLSVTLSRRYALLGVTGTVRMALSAIDIALWDALAVAAGLPLATLLGARPAPVVAYDSRGLGLMPPKRLADEATALLAKGLTAVKVRLGYPTLAEDLAAVRAVREAVPDDFRIMVDYNQALTLAEALARGRALEDQGLVWLEEPIRHDDYRGSAELARTLALPIQIGENFNGPQAFLDAVAAEAFDYVMPDVSRVGGVTGWMQTAGIAAAGGIEMSSHLYPEISAHLLAATPTAHWLEYVDWADAVLQDPFVVSDGAVAVPDRPGLGLAWDSDKLKALEPL